MGEGTGLDKEGKRVLFIGSGTGDHLWALLLNRWSYALKWLGHDVLAMDYREAMSRQDLGLILCDHYDYDVLILQDTHLPLPYALRAKSCAAHVAIITHSECIQGERDKAYLGAMAPDAVYTDQPVGASMFSAFAPTVRWLGVGADMRCASSPVKDIDILWIGNRYPEREADVEREVEPLLNTEYKVAMYGQGYPGEQVNPSTMFDLMSRAKIVVSVTHPGCVEGGYCGMRIADALASGAYVVSNKYFKDRVSFPCKGVSFVDRDGIYEQVLVDLHRRDREADALAGSVFVRRKRMAYHDMGKVMN